MESIIRMYDEAWNTGNVSECRGLSEGALTEDCELVEPRGRFSGREAIVERITGFTDRFPGARVDLTSKVDEHNGFARYGWKIVDGEGGELLAGPRHRGTGAGRQVSQDRDVLRRAGIGLRVV